MFDAIVESMIKMFADDAKIYKGLSTPGATQSLQRDLTRTDAYAKTNQLSLARKKCSVLRTGYAKEEEAQYYINGDKLPVVSQEKDLGIVMQSNLKFDTYLGQTVAKANQRLNLILRSFVSKDQKFLIMLYCT
jgi:hypothetical protein